MDKNQVRSCISGSGSITYDPLTGIIGGGGGGGVTPAALTKVDDTNVTLTLGGTPATALLQATSLTLGWSGQLSVARGGTGLSALGTANQLIRVNAGATALEYFTPTYLTGLTVGTTPIASGTAGRILFEGAGNVLQENAILNLDTTNGLIIGGATARGTRLTAINAANTNASKTLVVRNAADSATMMELSGDGVLRVQGTAGFGATISPYTSLDAFWLTTASITANADPARAGIFMTSTNIGMYAGTGARLRYVLKFETELDGPVTTDWHFISGGAVLAGSLYLATGSGTVNSKFHFTANAHFNVGAIGISTNGSNLIKVLNGTAPTANSTNCMQIYSQNITNASFHVRDSNDRIFYAGENVGMRSNHDLKLAANNTVYAVLSTAGRMYVGGSTTPTAVMHLAAGTATANTAPLKFTSGTLLSTAEAGAVEFLTDKAYLTITTGAARKEVTLNDAALTSGVTPVATTNGRLTDGLTLAQGTYTPTLTGVTNVASSTAYVCQYMRVGNVVTVSGMISVQATTNNSQTTIGISIPIASNFANANECGGTGYTTGNTINGHGASIEADPTNDRVTFDYFETHGGTDIFTFTFTYRII